MDICSFVNSKAIGEYLREIKYEFNTIEAAWLIFQCRSISVEERHQAWDTLMQEMPDCALEERMNCKPRESLYELIKEYMEITDKQYELFKKQEMGAVYQYRFYCKGDYSWCEDYEGLYESLEACWKEIDEDQDLGIEIVEIRKRYIGSNKTIDVTYKPDKTVMDVYSNNLTDEEIDVISLSFEGLWFDFPVPFKKGDILIENRMPGPRIEDAENGPFVMVGITPWETESNKERNKKGFGDNSDMNAWGYFQDNDGRIFHEVMFNYMNLEYYRGPFEGTKRLLVALSNFVKEIISLDLLLTAYRKVIMDEVAGDVMLHSWYTEDGLRLAGLNDVADENNKHLIESGLNPNIEFYLTDTFDWSKNQDLYNKCREIASNYKQPKEMLFIYGKHGCGKTTILQCLGNMAKQLSRRNLLYITAEEFTNTLNDLLTAGAQIVISADRSLDELEIPDALRSKLSFGTQMEMK